MKLFKNEYIFVATCISVLLLLSYIPILRNYAVAPAERHYIGSSPYPIDIYGDVEFIRDGYLGHVRVESKVDTWPQQYHWQFKILYIIVGHIARVMAIDPLSMFFLVRAVTSISFLLVAYWFIRQICKSRIERYAAYILTLFGCGITWPAVSVYTPGRAVELIGENMFVTTRFTQVAPHYFLASLFSLIAIYSLSRVLAEPRRFFYLILGGASQYITTVVFPPATAMLLMTFPFFVALRSIAVIKKSISMKTFIRDICILFCFTGLALSPVSYLRYLQTSIVNLEFVIHLNIGMLQYLAAVGLMYPFAFFAMLAIYRRSNILLTLCFAWVLAHPVAVLLFSGISSFSVRRIFTTPYVVIFSVLAVVGIIELIRILRGTHHTKILLSFFVGLILLAGAYTYKVSVEAITDCFCLTYPYGYPKKDVVAGAMWLKNNTHETDKVLSGLHTGSLITSFAGNRVYTNWWMYLANPGESQNVISFLQKFFSGTMKSTDATTFITRNAISYIMITDDDAQFIGATQPLSYPGLQNVFQSGNTIIYKTLKTNE